MSNDPYAGDELPIGDLERGPSAKFPELGDKYAGVITSVRRTPQTDFDTGEVLTWNDGTPRLQTLVELELADGTTTTLYAKGGKYEAAKGTGQSMEAAIVAAVKAAGGSSIRRGDMLAIEHTGLGKASRKGMNAPKLFTAEYRLAEPANASVAVDSLFTD
jgi:hypothetical protein